MKRNVGNLVIIASVILTVIVWFVFPPHNDGSDPTFVRRYAGEILGSSVIVLLSFRFISPVRWAELYFGGLDKMYRHTVVPHGILILFVHLLTSPFPSMICASGTISPSSFWAFFHRAGDARSADSVSEQAPYR
jgi:hypothetical protein